MNKVRQEDDEIIEHWLTDKHIKSCLGCLACRKKEVCAIKDDDMVQIYKDIVSSDFVIFSAPLYMGDVSGQFKLMFDRLYPMLDGPQGMYTPRYKGIKCCMVYSQGAPGILFGSAARTMKMRLKGNGFNCLGIVRETLTVDIRTVSDNKMFIKFGEGYSKWQKKYNKKLVDKICKRVR